MENFQDINKSLDQLHAKLGELDTLKKSVASQEAALNELVQKSGAPVAPAAAAPNFLDEAFEKLSKANFKSGEKVEIELPIFKASVAAGAGVVATTNVPTVTDLGTAFNGPITNGIQTAMRIVSTPGVDTAHWNQYLVGGDVSDAKTLASENDLLGLAAPTFVELTQKSFVSGVAGKLSRFAQSSKPELGNIFNVLLQRELHKVVDATLYNGHAPANYAGLKTSAKSWSAKKGATIIDAVAEFVNCWLPVNGLSGTGITLLCSPADLAALVNSKDQNGRYLISPSTEGNLNVPAGTLTLRGVPVRTSPSLVAGEFYFILDAFAEINISDAPVVVIGQEGTDVRQNQLTYAVSMRYAPITTLDCALIKVVLS